MRGRCHLADLPERVRGADAAMHVTTREAAKRTMEGGRRLIETKGKCLHGERPQRNGRTAESGGTGTTARVAREGPARVGCLPAPVESLVGQ
jgi:hypothetical protein